MGYLDWLPSPAAKCPPWLSRAWGGIWLTSVGFLLDAMTDSAKQAVRLRFPSFAPPDALAALGEERSTVRATAVAYEFDVPYAARLRRAWSDRELLGTKTGTKRLLEAIGFTVFQVLEQHEWNPSGPWQRGYIYLDKPHPWGPHVPIGPGWTIGDGTTLGSTASIVDVQNVQACLRPWCSPPAKMTAVVHLTSGPVLGGGWVLGDGSILADDSVCSWPLGADYP